MVSAPCRPREFELERYTGGSFSAIGQKFPFLPARLLYEGKSKERLEFSCTDAAMDELRHLTVIPVTGSHCRDESVSGLVRVAFVQQMAAPLSNSTVVEQRAVFGIFFCGQALKHLTLIDSDSGEVCCSCAQR
jgi:hypothetical protein